jgi:hypothetical protein
LAIQNRAFVVSVTTVLATALATALATLVAIAPAASAASVPKPTGAHSTEAATRLAGPRAASGGDCIDYEPIDISAIMDIASCVSENRSKNIASDAHFSYLGGPFSLVSCRFTISVRDDSIPTTVARQTFNNCNFDPGVVTHAAVAGHHYHTYLWVLLTLSNGQTYLSGDVFNSPEQIAG